MTFRQDFIEQLANIEERREAKFFNGLPVTSQSTPLPHSTRLQDLQKTIKEQTENEKLKLLLEQKTLNKVNYAHMLENIYECSTSDLSIIMQHLESFPTTKDLKRFIKELKEYQELNIEITKARYHPKGLYGCLNKVSQLCSISLTVPPSLPMQQALLTGIVMPVLSLFSDLELNGDLKIDSVPKIQLAKAKILEALIQFKNTHSDFIEEEINQLNAKMKNDLAPLNRELSTLEQELAELQHDYKAQAENITPEKKLQFEEDILTVIKEINELNTKIEDQTASLSRYITRKREQLIETRKQEANGLEAVFNGANSELDFIKNTIEALDKKKNIIEMHPSEKRSEVRKRRKELEELKEKTGFHYLLSDESIQEEKKFIKNHGGKLLHHLNQSKLAAMGHSNGLCGGYSAEFLEICTDDGWDDLSFKQKISNFKPILANKQSIRLDASSVNITRNDLWMTLESGLRWDIQGTTTDGATLFEIKSGDKAHATFKKEKDNVRAFYKRYVDGIMEQTSKGDSAKLMLWFFGKSGEGHAVALNYDKDGLLFHDSNTGYIHFEDAKKFASFLTDYLCKNYPDLADNCAVYDYNVIKKKVSRYNFNLEREKTIQQIAAPDELTILKKQESTILESLSSVKSNLTLIRKELAKTKTMTNSNSLAAKTPEEKTDESNISSTLPLQRTKAVNFVLKPAVSNQKLKQVKKDELIKALITQYMDDYDTQLDDKPVLKQKIFHEIKIFLDKNKTPDLEALRKLNQQHQLGKCDSLLNEIERVNNTNIRSARPRG